MNVMRIHNAPQRGFLCLLILALGTAACTQNEKLASDRKRAGTDLVPRIAGKAGQPDQIILPPDSPKLSRIQVKAAEMVTIPVDEVVAPGKVELNPNRISRMVMPASGRVRQVLVKLGDSVIEGQPLLTIDSPDAGASLTAYVQAQAQLRQTSSALSKAEKDLSRQRELYSHGATAYKEVLAAENDLTQAQAAIEQARAASDEALHRLDLFGLKPGLPSYITLRAPIHGKILEISVVAGEYRTDTSTAVMTIADLRSVWIGADVPESAIRLIEKGEPIQVDLSAYPGDVFRARVARIADTVDPQTRTIKVEAEINNTDGRLRPEMFGQIRHSHGTRPMLVVPAGAVIQKEGKCAVLLEQGPGCFREKTVKIGTPRGDLIPILSGISSGDRVVVDGTMLLSKEKIDGR
jgi:cobalt-zinc-cadmium efflux system membrane fusion protein